MEPEIASAPAMDSNEDNSSGIRPPFDPDNYPIGLHKPPFESSYNFSDLPPSMPAENDKAYALNGIFMLASFVVLFAVLLFLFVVCIYTSYRRRQYPGISLRSGLNSISWRRGFSFAREDPLTLRNVGLDVRDIETLPVFAYKAQSFKDPLECAVCLSEFEENEKARLLPNCKHSFHVDCIDMWFRSHSTCPICRTGAQPQQREGNNNNKTDEISINVELISSGNIEIRIGPGLEQGETSSQQAKTVVGEEPSTSGISLIPETATDMPGRSESLSREKRVCLHSGSQSSKTALHSLKRMLSRGREGRVFPSASQDHGIETEDVPNL